MSRIQAIARLLEDSTAGGARRLAQVFEDFVELAAITLRNAVDHADQAAWQAREARFAEVAARYTADERTRFAEALALVTIELHRAPGDVLGSLYMSLDLGNERLGQFFTPYSVAQVMASLAAPSLVQQIRETGHATLYEPACGAGAFIIAVAEQLRAVGLEPQRTLRVSMEDVYAQAMHMSYIHLSLLHVPAAVHHRDTLTGESFSSWPTFAFLVQQHQRKPQLDSLVQGEPR